MGEWPLIKPLVFFGHLPEPLWKLIHGHWLICFVVLVYLVCIILVFCIVCYCMVLKYTTKLSPSLMWYSWIYSYVCINNVLQYAKEFAKVHSALKLLISQLWIQVRVSFSWDDVDNHADVGQCHGGIAGDALDDVWVSGLGLGIVQSCQGGDQGGVVPR